MMMQHFIFTLFFSLLTLGGGRDFGQDIEAGKAVATFSRASIEERLADKRKARQPLVIHLLVPLCDNDHQGIVPVKKTLGNGLDPKNNLYWGALYGVKTHFSRSAGWTSQKDMPSPHPNVLERVAFRKSMADGQKVFLVADAYRGDRMKECLDDLLGSVAGLKQGTQAVEVQDLGLFAKADLLAFAGHNGLMDEEVDFPRNSDGIFKDVVVVGCISHGYFRDPLEKAGGYPLVTTTGLMAPEAYVLEGIFDAWAVGKSPDEIRLAAASQYHAFQKCGMKSATNLFRTGW
ncbi:MAG: hypothetical protein H6581_28825 [Bacteroidia bacterium]|nr:hypothetical protein [Bacteroidia bacterium]